MRIKKLIISALIFFLALNTGQSFNKKYHVKCGVTIDKSDCRGLSKLVIILPYPGSHEYQAVSNAEIYSGELLEVPETFDDYLRFTLEEDELDEKSDTFQVFFEFDVSLNAYNFRFEKVTQIFPYLEFSKMYKYYTGPGGEYIDPDNPIIQETGDSIWAESEDIIDYARNCYEYVAANYSYLNPMTGLHTLVEILEAGGGDCGNLSSIYISLLRYKKIPSRHIITIRPDGSPHVWTDFYLENYGYLPVDVTYKNSDPEGDYFGKYNGDGIVFSQKVWIELQRGDEYSYFTPLLQTFNWWYWHDDEGCNDIKAEHYFSSEEIPFSINALANPPEGGTIENAGDYFGGDSVKLIARAADGFRFVNWTCNDIELSSNPEYLFIVNGDMIYTANFEPDNSINDKNKMDRGSIDIVPNPTEGRIFIKSSFEKILQLKIYDIHGRRIDDDRIKSDFINNSADVSDLDKGIYIINLLTGKDTTSKLLIVH